jgi:nucleotide-binding universal stress UspA family protein
MYKKIVVPLDGSKLAEVAVPHLDNFTKASTEVFLVSVTEPVKGLLVEADIYEPFVSEHPEKVKKTNIGVSQMSIVYSGADGKTNGAQEIPFTLGKMASSAGDYLRAMAETLTKKGFNITAGVLTGNPATEIIRFAEEHDADLILIASRGKSGFSRWEMGNIADKIIRASKTPVLLVKPAADFKETKPKRRGSTI